MSRLILASGSPRRRELLGAEGFEFEVRVPGIDERARAGESPLEQARRLALQKARAVAGASAPDQCVLAADTLVVVADTVLGKPRDEAEAQRMLLQLAGRTHRVHTGWALCGPAGQSRQGVETSVVRMRAVSADEAAAYAATGEPLDKAGAYAVQGRGGRFVENIEGSRSNVIGLPLERVVPALLEAGVCRPQPDAHA